MLAYVSDKDDIRLGMENVSRVKIEDPGNFSLAAIEGYEGAIVDARNIKYALNFITRVRSAPQLEFFLKPLFLYSDTTVTDPYLIEIADGQVDSRNILDAFSYTRRIVERTENFHSYEGHRLDHRIVLKTLQLMVSRDKDLKPVVMPKSRFGYVYPLITVNFPIRDDSRMFDILEIIDRENLADGIFHDRIHLCPECHSAFLNFREECPRCGSANLEVDDLIHHFPCAYVGPEREFRVNDRLVCPKCGRTLRHIGMDYDKPSVIYTCRDCDYSFQEPDVSGVCFYCGTSTSAERLLIKDIKIYKVSQVTINCAINGIILTLSDIITSTMQVYSPSSFQLILEYEYKKQKRYSANSVLVHITFDFGDREPEKGEDRREIFVEIARVIKKALRESDAITAVGDNNFAILLQEVTPEQARAVIERIKEDIDKFLKRNFPKVKLKIKVDYMTLEEALNKSIREEVER